MDKKVDMEMNTMLQKNYIICKYLQSNDSAYLHFASALVCLYNVNCSNIKMNNMNYDLDLTPTLKSITSKKLTFYGTKL